nr:hypothetical protein [uncultured Undibacterium sp.]
MTTKFDAFKEGLEALCIEHSVSLDNEFVEGRAPSLRVFDAQVGEKDLALDAYLSDYTNLN